MPLTGTAGHQSILHLVPPDLVAVTLSALRETPNWDRLEAGNIAGRYEIYRLYFKLEQFVWPILIKILA